MFDRIDRRDIHRVFSRGDILLLRQDRPYDNPRAYNQPQSRQTRGIYRKVYLRAALYRYDNGNIYPFNK